ncbi:autotransporter domain-containing protein [Ponticaulis koreensis]|uniref:autotransporter domain-containing protein n=1 Tax=Ponticaulis koreensis TaxID=1123045 RepID=UPI00138AD3A1|nr:autotransporter domain-containing protein [Ponticaulis koreensis]
MKSKTFMAHLATTSALALSVALAPAANALTVRDDVTVAGSEEYADNTQWDGVVQIYMLNNQTGGITFNCTGSLINGRTVLSAAHCFNDFPSTFYDADANLLSPIIAYGPDTFDALFGWLSTGAASSFYEIDERNGLVLGNQVLIHPDADPAFGSALNFPSADVAMVSLSNPLAHLPSYSMLFSPVGVGEHVSMVGYGGHGIGSTGDVGIDGKRQAGENLIGMVGSQVDFLSAIFGTDATPYYTNAPGANQSMYWIDFDNPDRTGDECGRDGIGDWACTDGVSWFFFDDPINNTWFNTSLSNDIFPDDALPYESGTAGGDSGSAIFFDQLGDAPIIGGVLSGGFTFVSPVPSGYSDVSYYNPLFNYYDFIVEANPYKYVSAIEGDGLWSDATHWVQDLDPNYLIIDENGNLVNGIPDAPEPGVGSDGPDEGIVLDVDIAPAQQTEGTPAGTAGVDASANAVVGSIGENRPAGGLLIEGDGIGDANFGSVSGGSVWGTTGDAELITYQYGDIGSPTALAGPGSTNFVPNNGLQASGFYNYFDVTLSNAGTTTVDIFAEVDSLTIANLDATLRVNSDAGLWALVDTQVIGGTLENNGVFISRDILNVAGVLTGTGTYNAETLWNAGLLTPGEGMSLIGDLVMTSASVFGYTGNSLSVDGDASFGGSVLFGTPYQFGDTGTLITYTGASTGTIADTDLLGVLYATYADVGGALNYTIEAASFESVLPTITDENTQSLVDGLNRARSSSYDDMSGVYGVLDYLSGDQLLSALEGVTPHEQGSVVNGLLAGNNQLGVHLQNRFAAIAQGNANGAAFNRTGTSGVQVAGSQEMAAFALAAEATAAQGGGSVNTQSDTGMGSFVEVSYYTGTETNALNNETSDLDGITITAGIDRELEPGFRMGAFLSYTDGETTYNSSVGGNESDGVTLGIYAAYAGENGINLNAYAGAGQRGVTSTRIDVLTGGTLLGSTDADEFVIGAELSRAYDTGHLLFIEPSFGIDYASFDVDGYSERGGAGALTFDDIRARTAQVHAGADFHFFNPDSPSKFRPTIGADFIYDLATDGTTVSSFFNGASPSTFQTVGPESDSSWVDLSAQLQYYSSDNLSFNGFVSQSLGRDELDITTFGLNVRATF